MFYPLSVSGWWRAGKSCAFHGCFEGKLARGKLGTHGTASLLYLSPVKKDGVGRGPDVNQITPGHPCIPEYHITGSAFLAWVPRPGWVMMILYTYPSCSSS